MSVGALSSFEVKYRQLLAKRLEQIIHDESVSLALGHKRKGDPGATAEAYADAVGYVRALNDVLGLMEEIEDNLMGRGKQK